MKKYYTYICLEKTERSRIEKVCKDILARDKTFVFRIYKNTVRKGKCKNKEFIVSVRSKTNDQAHRRGTWMINKLSLSWYWVKSDEENESDE